MKTNQNFIELLSTQFATIESYFKENIYSASYEDLSAIPAWGGWSVLEVLDHLNFYNRWYLPKIDEAIQRHRISSVEQTVFKSGWLGAYFTKMMKSSPDGTVASKMKAPKNAIPATVLNPDLVISQFSSHLSHLHYLLKNAVFADLNKGRVVTSLSSFVRMNTGDSLAFLLAHMERHFCQIQSIQKGISHSYVITKLEKVV